MKEFSKYVGLDVHKATIAVSVAPRQRRRGSVRWGDRQYAGGNREAGKAAKARLFGAIVLLRGWPMRLWHISAIDNAWLALQRSCPVADTEESGRSSQDGPSRQHVVVEAASRGRTDGGMGAGWVAGSATRFDTSPRGYEASATASQTEAAGVSAAAW